MAVKSAAGSECASAPPSVPLAWTAGSPTLSAALVTIGKTRLSSRERKDGVHHPRARQRSTIFEDHEARLVSEPFVPLAIGP